MVRQLETAAHPPPDTVKLVGRVTKMQSGKSEWRFRLTDGSGTIVLRNPELQLRPIESVEERIAREESEDLDEIPVSPPPWEDDIYMRVFGKVEVDDGKKNIEVIQMHPITDFNEVTLHSLECIYAHCQLTRGT